jgi:cytochrome P450
MPARAKIPPGPRLPALAQTALLYHDPVGCLERWKRRYGPVFRVRISGFPRYVYVTDPQLARELYAADRTVGRAGDARRDFLAPLVGQHSLLVTEDEEWLRHRRLLGPVFHRNHVDGYAQEIAAVAADHIGRWPLGEPVALRPRMQEITLEVILRLVFGVTDEARLQRFREVLPDLLDSAGGIILWLLPPALWSKEQHRRRLRRLPTPLRAFMRAQDEVDALIHEQIRLRRAEIATGPDDDRRDVLSMLLRARDEEGRGMSDAELRDELITLLEAGHETTATALAWTFERLVRHPAAHRALVEAVDAGGEDAEAHVEAVVRESLRVRPVVIDTPRALSGDLRIGGWTVPAGWLVAPAIPTVHADDGGAPEATSFRPERFLDGGTVRDGWIPFGGGKRHCVGSHLALLELRVVAAEVVRRLDVAAVRPEGERQRIHHVTLVPSEGALVRLSRRVTSPSTARASSAAATAS